ncbi:glycosyltransferase family 2 protein [Bradyrhizobium cytisi]|uniref:glycosyltransferase family 2 protein n=1 Tax=Bradyrhizobium cytisi TaxID=515489 RepID=UPI001FEA1597|nr:glycosyltransferase family 2 protein [Bradyrhizobium cytisi]
MKTILRHASGFRLGQFQAYPPRPIRAPAAGPDYISPLSISIVTPVLNQAAFVAQTIESVLMQRVSPLEYIVIDGGSTDGTTDTVALYRKYLSHFESQKDSGQSDALNKGFALASGDILGWLNGDDFLLPGALEFVARFFTAHPDVDVVYGDRIVVDRDSREIGRWMLPSHSNRILSWVDYIPQETVFWRRRLWERVGSRLDDSFDFAMDWELLVRFRECGARFRHLPRFIGAFRVHSAQKTIAQKDLGLAEMNRIRGRCLGYVPSEGELRLAVIPYVMRHLGREWRSRLMPTPTARS